MFVSSGRYVVLHDLCNRLHRYVWPASTRSGPCPEDQEGVRPGREGIAAFRNSVIGPLSRRTEHRIPASSLSAPTTLVEYALNMRGKRTAPPLGAAFGAPKVA